jgi:hypothetical protein
MLGRVGRGRRSVGRASDRFFVFERIDDGWMG